ncbi:hypothetical protein RJ641_009484 [Dillenia turbinata]|uniref:Uncharacterized protein n=1 Tax=Dillenia turbinata TaxID=194707 RepID=A0AAN8Z979_9MAGN
MFDPQNFVDLREDLQRTHSSLSNASAINSNVDRVLFNDLVEIVPLVQSLIDRKANSSYTRRGSIAYTKTPARELNSKKSGELKGRNAAHSIPGKKRRDLSEKIENQEGSSDASSIFSSSRALAVEKDTEELATLREQVEDLQRRLLEKEELLKLAELSKSEITAVNKKLDDLKHQSAEKDSIIKSTQLQLSDAKIKLADRQAALEKSHWEIMTSNKKTERLQEELDTISSFIKLFESLTGNGHPKGAKDYDVSPYEFDHLPYIDDLDEVEMEKMEKARVAYINAIAIAKEKQDDESITTAANARVHLQSFAFQTR